MYKMDLKITKETLENNGIEVIVDSVNTLWLNEKNTEEKLGHKNLPIISNKYNKIYKKHRGELVNKPIKQSDGRFLHIDFALKIIMDYRTVKGLNYTMLLKNNTKEQAIINSIKDTFQGENIQTQYSALGYIINLYFHKYKLAIQVDELGHTNRNINNEIKKQKA